MRCIGLNSTDKQILENGEDKKFGQYDRSNDVPRVVRGRISMRWVRCTVGGATVRKKNVINMPSVDGLGLYTYPVSGYFRSNGGAVCSYLGVGIDVAE